MIKKKGKITECPMCNLQFRGGNLERITFTLIWEGNKDLRRAKELEMGRQSTKGEGLLRVPFEAD